VDLTPREREVLDLVGEGYGNQEISDQLHLGVTTVKKHIATLMYKTGCDNRVRLAVFDRPVRVVDMAIRGLRRG
jgi:DNA-binding NarL/FixJ family response regulator